MALRMSSGKECDLLDATVILSGMVLDAARELGRRGAGQGGQTDARRAQRNGAKDECRPLGRDVARGEESFCSENQKGREKTEGQEEEREMKQLAGIAGALLGLRVLARPIAYAVIIAQILIERSWGVQQPEYSRRMYTAEMAIANGLAAGAGALIGVWLTNLWARRKKAKE